MTASQFQQSPIPRGGAIIKSDWWQMWPADQARPPFEFLLASVDTAYTEKQTNDPCALTIWGVNHDDLGNPRIFLLWAWQDWADMHTLVDFLVAVCQQSDRITSHPKFPVHKLLIEAAANGISVAQEMERVLRMRATFGIELLNPRMYGGDKSARLRSVEHVFASGMVWANDRDWAQKVIWQAASVPYTKDDHLADTVAMAIRWLRDRGYMPIREEAQEAWYSERAYQPPLRPLYPIVWAALAMGDLLAEICQGGNCFV
jgi:phage terminase large subunit-like protein